MIWLLAVACALATVPASLRWLRVAQREHYLPPAASQFALRWTASSPVNRLLDLASVAGLVGAVFDLRWGFLTALAQIGPIGLPVKGVTSPLSWTPRLRRLATVVGLILVGAVSTGALIDQPLMIVAPLLFLPWLIDLTLLVLGPIERRLSDQWVEKAAAKLKRIGPVVVAITGSYGKTSTKNYVTHLLTGSRAVVASPASFNNRMGLARAINEGLTLGTEVFVAEMGTYGPGEIADLCSWMPPKVAAIVAVGPVHLERFKTLERIVAAKAEILDQAMVGVICVDDPLLAELARERAGSMEIIEVSTDDEIHVDGLSVGSAPEGVFAPNLGVAIAICHRLGMDMEVISARVPSLATPEHRQSVTKAVSGFAIIDNTFNSNPAGARSALDLLAREGNGGTTAVITPGMVELGRLQFEENRLFAEVAAASVDHLVIVGRTNRRALLEGSAGGKATVTVVATRQEAVQWAREHLGPGDAVLYENDLPDHYP